MATLSELEDAVELVTAGEAFSEAAAVFSRKTGAIHLRSDIEDMGDFPEDAEGNPDYVWIPSWSELGAELGRRAALDFVAEACPQLEPEAVRIFSRSGAFRRFKALLDQHGQLDAWYRLVEARKRAALLDWCEAEGLVLQSP
jgi:hypothetical protein